MIKIGKFSVLLGLFPSSSKSDHVDQIAAAFSENFWVTQLKTRIDCESSRLRKEFTRNTSFKIFVLFIKQLGNFFQRKC
ncbi:hypothetical protein T06_1977 [Trichinella sp. T6]|nr:hypothetical protein T06_1977 [Trichinella sp. T6]